MSNEILKTYKNSTPVVNINGYQVKVEDLVFASLIGGMNLLLVSERGEGKTQILYDVLYGIFGGNGTYIRVSPDMEIKDVYTALNLEKLRKKVGSSEDILEITEKARHPFTAVDELNRAPPIVQNQLLNVLDGYIEIKGERYPLGVSISGEEYHVGIRYPLGVSISGEEYHVGIATINLSDQKYLGTFGIDSAILDRFAFALNLDYYSPKVEDLLEIISESPKLKIPKGKEKTGKIFENYRKVKKKSIPFELLCILLYLREGIDYISAEPYSQRKTGGILPEGSHESGDLQALLYPISIRSLKHAIHLYKALIYIAELKGYEEREDFYFKNSLEVLKLILPYSGCFKKSKVDSAYYGNPLRATEEVIKIIEGKFEEKGGEIVEAIKRKREGKLDQSTLERFEGEWRFVKDLLSSKKLRI